MDYGEWRQGRGHCTFGDINGQFAMACNFDIHGYLLMKDTILIHLFL